MIKFVGKPSSVGKNMIKSKDVNTSFRTVAGGLNTSGLGIAIKPKVNVLKAP